MSSHESNELARDLARTQEELDQIQRERDELDLLEEEARSLATRETRLAMLSQGMSGSSGSSEGSEECEEDACEDEMYESMVVHGDTALGETPRDIGTLFGVMWSEGSEHQKRTLAALLRTPAVGQESDSSADDASSHPLTLQDIASEIDIGHVHHVLDVVSAELHAICAAHPYTRFNAAILEEFLTCVHDVVAGPEGLQLFLDSSFSEALRRRVYSAVGSSVSHSRSALLERVLELLIDESVFVALLEHCSQATQRRLELLRAAQREAHAQQLLVEESQERTRRQLFAERDTRLHEYEYFAAPPE